MIDWDFDKTFKDNNRNNIDVLQRKLPLVTFSEGQELAPFFQEPSFFQFVFKSDSNGFQVDRTTGVLSKISVVNLDVLVQVICDNSNRILEWLIESAISPWMTIWRVNGTLDTIQVNIRGKNCMFYMQTGGAMMRYILESAHKDMSPLSAKDNFVLIFEENAKGYF